MLRAYLVIKVFWLESQPQRRIPKSYVFGELLSVDPTRYVWIDSREQSFHGVEFSAALVDDHDDLGSLPRFIAIRLFDGRQLVDDFLLEIRFLGLLECAKWERLPRLVMLRDFKSEGIGLDLISCDEICQVYGLSWLCGIQGETAIGLLQIRDTNTVNSMLAEALLSLDIEAKENGFAGRRPVSEFIKCVLRRVRELA